MGTRNSVPLIGFARLALELPLSGAHLAFLERLPIHHRDPPGFVPSPNAESRPPLGSIVPVGEKWPLRVMNGVTREVEGRGPVPAVNSDCSDAHCPSDTWGRDSAPDPDLAALRELEGNGTNLRCGDG